MAGLRTVWVKAMALLGVEGVEAAVVDALAGMSYFWIWKGIFNKYLLQTIVTKTRIRYNYSAISTDSSQPTDLQ